MRSQACLSVDDLDGLNYLYPTCDLTRQQPPSCVKSRRNSGWLRLVLSCGAPTLIGLFLVRLRIYYAKPATLYPQACNPIRPAGADAHLLRQAP